MESKHEKAILLLDSLMVYFKVSTFRELSKKIGVSYNTITSWKRKGALRHIRKVFYEHDIPLPDVEEGVGEVDLSIPSDDSAKLHEIDLQMKKIARIAYGSDLLELLEEELKRCRKKIISQADSD